MTFSVWVSGSDYMARDTKVLLYHGKQRRVCDDLFSRISAAVEIYGLPLRVDYELDGDLMRRYPCDEVPVKAATI